MLRQSHLLKCNFVRWMLELTTRTSTQEGYARRKGACYIKLEIFWLLAATQSISVDFACKWVAYWHQNINSQANIIFKSIHIHMVYTFGCSLFPKFIVFFCKRTLKFQFLPWRKGNQRTKLFIFNLNHA